jgi:hypothetical protein
VNQKNTNMKKLLAVLIVGVSLYACGPSSESTTDNPGTISSPPTSDPATSDSTGAVKETEVPTVPTDSTSVPQYRQIQLQYHQYHQYQLIQLQKYQTQLQNP